jgi:hypothetical protein
MMVNAILKQLSICPCGFPLLKVEIPLGSKYEAFPLRHSR